MIKIVLYDIKNRGKYKIGPYCWLKLQIIPYGIKNNLEVLVVGLNCKLIHIVKFLLTHMKDCVSMPRHDQSNVNTCLSQ